MITDLVCNKEWVLTLSIIVVHSLGIFLGYLFFYMKSKGVKK